MSFFAPSSSTTGLSIFNTQPIYQPTNNTMLFVLFITFFVMAGGIIFYYLSRLSQEAVDKDFFRNENLPTADKITMPLDK